MARTDTSGNPNSSYFTKLVKPQDNADAEKIQQLKDELQIQALDLDIQCQAMQNTVAELEESRNRYADLYDFAPVGYMTSDEKGCISEVNLAGAALLGTERSRLIGVPLSAFVDSGNLNLLFNHLHSCKHSGKTVITELKLSSKNVNVVYAQLITMQVPNGGSDGVHYRTIITNITELRHTKTEIAYLQATEKALLASQERLKYYSAELMETNNELKAFVYIVAHDFRAPMVNLKGFSRELGYSLIDLKQIICEATSQLPENNQRKAVFLMEKDIPDALNFIEISVDKLSRMVDALLKLANLGRREMIYNMVDIGELVANVMRSFHHQIGLQGIQIDVVGPLPQMETNQLAMEQIFSNLLDNAIKYLDTDRQGKIALSCTHAGDEYLFTIEDNGCGIIAADLDRIFESLRRVGKQDVPGDGMGLAYVRVLVKQLGGKIWCSSKPGIGTKMFFTASNGPVKFNNMEL